MFDIVIYNAKADRGRAAPLGKALEARGFTVDMNSDPAAASTAKVIMVIWSPAGVRDAGVLSAAGSAGERFVPVVLEPENPPPQFVSTSTEILTAWPGVAGLGAFERLILRLESMTAKRALPASAIPQNLLDEASRAAKKSRGSREFWSRIVTAGSLLGLGIVGYGVVSAVIGPGGLTPPPPPIACTVQQQFCLTADDLRSMTEGKLIDTALERSSLISLKAGALENDPLAAGILCLHDVYRTEDAAAAQASCQSAAKLNSPLGSLGLAALLNEGRAPIAKDVAAAKALLEKAAADGDARAQYQLALLLREEGQDARVATLLEQCVAAAYAPCQYLLAYRLENGEGVPKNIAEAVRIYDELANPEKAFPQAASSLGYIYEMGAEGITKDLPNAIIYYQRAALFGDAFALYRLGALAEAGLLPDKTAADALTYYRDAVAAGSAEAGEALARLSAAQP